MRFIQLFLCTVVLALGVPADLLYSQSSDKEMRELLKSLKYEKEINVIIDFSKAKIHGKSESDFVYIEDISSTEDWTTLWETEYKPGLCHDLLGEFNTNML
jgi:trans-aconitate methyltransferase